MQIQDESFLNMVFIGIIALFPVVNPIGSAVVLNPFFQDLTRQEKRQAVLKITLYAFFICIFSLFAGHWVLQLFGLSIPVVQLGGGVMICKLGWESLSDQKKNADHDLVNSHAEVSGFDSVKDKLFYPITFPATTGAGTISVIFTLSAHTADFGTKAYFFNVSSILVSIIVMCIMIYIFYLNTKTILRYLGPNGETIVNRISAFIIFCVGLQIGLSGLRKLFDL